MEREGSPPKLKSDQGDTFFVITMCQKNAKLSSWFPDFVLANGTV